MARRMDPARFTGGVRCKKNSSFLEDVYTYNDFSYDGLGPALLAPKKAAGRSCPYVVSEHTGHMYPAKMFDDEAQRLEHALRHARVLEAAFADTSIAGSFGWCMFDYQTHEQFGSGDGICYHGVMDMFRNPKLAAALYASQGGRGVCELASSVAPGDYAGTRPGLRLRESLPGGRFSRRILSGQDIFFTPAPPSGGNPCRCALRQKTFLGLWGRRFLL